MTKKLKEENYDRIISSIFQALAGSFDYIRTWEQGDKDVYFKKLISYLDLKKATKIKEEVKESNDTEQISSISKPKPKKAKKEEN